MSGSHLVWIVLALGSSLFAQVGSVAPPPGSRQNANSITLNVAVTNSSGAAVTSLQKQDFTLLDNKQPQTITSFEAPSAGNAAQVIIVLDAVNIGFTRLAYARGQIEKALRQENGRLARPISLAIFTDSGFNIQPEASQDGNALAAYLDGQDIGLRTTTRSQGFYGASDRSQMSVRALQQLADSESRRPGRKVVVWISPGWPLLSGPRMELSRNQTLAIFDTIVELSTDLERAGITLYSVDPIGTTEGMRSFYWEEFQKPVTAPNNAQLADLSLQVFAVHSGGRVLMGSNDIAGLIQQCVRQASEFYRLTYEPPAAADRPNEYHSIAIKLDQPHLKASTLAGYYAYPQKSSQK
jgi:VWFA-related protein